MSDQAPRCASCAGGADPDRVLAVEGRCACGAYGPRYSVADAWEPRLRINLLTSEGDSPARVERYTRLGLNCSGQLVAWDRALRFCITVEQDNERFPRRPWARKVTFRRDVDALGRVRG